MYIDLKYIVKESCRNDADYNISLFIAFTKTNEQSMYLSEQIKAMAERKKVSEKSLVSKNYSCGIFQNYDRIKSLETKSPHKDKDEH